ncbi:MAG: hypothetical protein ACR2P4_02325 [Gammaproteobacteria bacterium]
MGFFTNLKKRRGVGLGGAVFLYGLLRVVPLLLVIAAILFAAAKMLFAEFEPVSARLPDWTGLIALFFGGIALSIVGALSEARFSDLAEKDEAAKTGKAKSQPSAEQGGAKPSAIDGNNPPCVRKECSRNGKIPSQPLCSICHSHWEKQKPLCCAKCGYKHTNRPLCRLCYSKWRKENASADSATASANDFRKKYPAKYRADVGYEVDSKAEVIIGNYLHNRGIKHTRGRKLPVEEDFYCDFYLPEKQVYIEYWGLDDPEYLQKKTDKLAVYKKYNFKLIQLHDAEVQNLDDHMPRLLRQFGIKVS